MGSNTLRVVTAEDRLCPHCKREMPRNEIGGIAFDYFPGTLSWDGHVVRISPGQADILKILWDAFPAPVTKDRLFDGYSGIARTNESSSNSLSVQIMHTRRGIKDVPLEIESLYGRGWRLKLKEG